MRRIVLWGLSTVTTVVLLFGYHTSTQGATGLAGTKQAPVGGGTSSPEANPSASTSASPASTPVTVTGAVAQTSWGPVQVQITTAGGAITNVEVLKYPDGNGTDYEINQYALPRLIRETIDAQSAQIDMISGATITSGGYLQSLQSALDQANL